ncbi:hypothetical protein BD410DRAFT_441883 [Rickenella mellea]|uniref:Uncharacterized protein n=1 Tax=Rickenella mellea TaxID=50990 RepID=A0A4Y7PWJ4_9AGAM|nr:hypothetical protein BD410DRAFT_441883 [Rickenella mellea]
MKDSFSWLAAGCSCRYVGTFRHLCSQTDRFVHSGSTSRISHRPLEPQSLSQNPSCHPRRPRLARTPSGTTRRNWFDVQPTVATSPLQKSAVVSVPVVPSHYLHQRLPAHPVTFTARLKLTRLLPHNPSPKVLRFIADFVYRDFRQAQPVATGWTIGT